MKTIIVAGIGTDVGKTIVSAILVEALEADYWKPIQAGNLENTDTNVVSKLTSNQKSIFHPEAYQLKTPASPHAAAKIDNVEIHLDKIQIPITKNNLIIELAGGLMVPLNNKQLNIDLIKKWNASVILVSHNYLGSINHTLLSIEVLKNNNLKLLGLIFNGEENKSTQNFILQYTKIPCIGYIHQLSELDKVTIKKQADNLKKESQFNTLLL